MIGPPPLLRKPRSGGGGGDDVGARVLGSLADVVPVPETECLLVLNFIPDGQTAAGEKVPLSGKTVVIGGGNVAVDVARTALRSGAQEAHIFCLEPRDEMPAWEQDVDEAVDEGIVINSEASPSRIAQQDGRVTGIEFTHCVCVFDDEGCFNPNCDLEDTRFVDADNVIISIGQAADMSFLDADSQLERELWGTLVVDTNTLATNIPGVFAGGDFTTGPTFVIRAISSGRRAAIASTMRALQMTRPATLTSPSSRAT